MIIIILIIKYVKIIILINNFVLKKFYNYTFFLKISGKMFPFLDKNYIKNYNFNLKEREKENDIIIVIFTFIYNNFFLMRCTK